LKFSKLQAAQFITTQPERYIRALIYLPIPMPRAKELPHKNFISRENQEDEERKKGLTSLVPRYATITRDLNVVNSGA